MHLLGRNKGITVYGPQGLEQIIRMQLEIGGAELTFPVQFVELDGKEAKMLFEDKLIEITTFPLKHRIPTNGFRINEKPRERSLDGDKFKQDGLSLSYIPRFKHGVDVTLEDGTVLYANDYTFPSPPSKSYAYCSDTVYEEKILPYIQGVDVLYHEATFLEAMADRAKVTFHSTALQAAQIAKKAGVKRLFLGHLSARYLDSAAHIAEAAGVFEAVEVVEDGMTIRL